MNVAQIILSQLGGGRFVAMTGARNFLGREDGLSFKIGRNAGRISHVRVTLTPADDYTVEFLRVHGSTIKTVSKCDGIYCDNLAEVVSDATGLAVRL